RSPSNCEVDDKAIVVVQSIYGKRHRTVRGQIADESGGAAGGGGFFPAVQPSLAVEPARIEISFKAPLTGHRGNCWRVTLRGKRVAERLKIGRDPKYLSLRVVRADDAVAVSTQILKNSISIVEVGRNKIRVIRREWRREIGIADSAVLAAVIHAAN